MSSQSFIEIGDTMVRTQNPARREAFLDAALKLFVANGMQNTSTAEIARAAGTAAGTLFIYFPTKQALINELVLEIGRKQSDSINALLEPALPARETFLTIWNGTVEWFLDHMDAFTYIQQVRDTGLIGENVVQESASFFGYYYDAIQKGFAEGSIKAYPIELIGDFLYHDIMAVINLIRREVDPSKHEQYIQLGFNVFWDGIKFSPAEE
jgi:AcrR family transcriptional regulator